MSPLSPLLFFRDVIFPPSYDFQQAHLWCCNPPRPRMREKNMILTLVSMKHHLTPEALHSFKYERNTEVRDILQKYLLWGIQRLLDVHGETRGQPIVIVVPPRPERFQDIGYDQGSFLCNQLITTLPNIFIASQPLRRRSGRLRQAHITDTTDRIRNAHNAFILDTTEARNVAGRWIILVDDVSTTGSTLRDARRALLTAHPQHVTLLAIAG